MPKGDYTRSKAIARGPMGNQNRPARVAYLFGWVSAQAKVGFTEPNARRGTHLTLTQTSHNIPMGCAEIMVSPAKVSRIVEHI
jgi:hypothetical protein